MPIYEYACKNCGHTLDVLQKMSDDPLQDCPECHEPKLKRLISAPSFRLKGNGWYETDFKKENRRNLSGNDADAPKKEAKAGKSGDSKPKSATESPAGNAKPAGGTNTRAADGSD